MRVGSLVLFDYEGQWGMPHGVTYDIDGTTSRILDVLGQHDVHAMFFVVGRLVEERPDIIARLHEAGQALGVHGYRHERLYGLSAHALQSLGKELGCVREIIAGITGTPPVAFRAPYLMAPRFVDRGVTQMLLDTGFLWTSNRLLLYPEQITNSNRLQIPAGASLLERFHLMDVRHPLGKAAFVALNLKNVARDPDLGLRRGVAWLLGARGPLVRSGGLYDLAVASPLDANFLGLPKPEDPTPVPLENFTTSRLADAGGHGGTPYTVTFHDWVIGTSNRIRILDGILSELARSSPLIDARDFDPRTLATA